MKFKEINIYNILLFSSFAFGPGIQYKGVYLFHILLGTEFLLFLFNKKKIKRINLLYLSPFILMIFFGLVYLPIKPDYYSVIIRIFIYNIFGMIIIYNFLTIDTKSYYEIFKLLKYILYIELFFATYESITGFDIVTILSQGIITNENSAKVFFYFVPSGFRGNPNNFSVLINLVIPFYLFPDFIKNKKERFFILTILFILLVLTGGRLNLLVFLMITGLYFIFYLKPTKKINLILFFIIIVTVLLIINKDIIYNSFYIIFRYASLAVEFFTGSSVDHSSSVRQQLLSNAFSAFRDSYFMGIGPGLVDKLGNIDGIENLHNYWAQILIEYGLIIGFLYYTYWAYLIKQLIIISRYDNFSKALILTVVGFLFGVIAMSTVYYYFPIYILLGVVGKQISIRKSMSDKVCCKSQILSI